MLGPSYKLFHFTFTFTLKVITSLVGLVTFFLNKVYDDSDSPETGVLKRQAVRELVTLYANCLVKY